MRPRRRRGVATSPSHACGTAEAARHFANAAAALPAEGAHQDKHIDYLRKEADALYLQGDEFGDNDALVMSDSAPTGPCSTWRRASACRCDWAATQNDFGIALWSARRARERHGAAQRGGRGLSRSAEGRTRASASRCNGPRPRTISALRWRALGERESDTARLNEAVAAFREALEGTNARARPAAMGPDPEQSRQCVGRLGERESDTARLNEAVAAFREALKECTRERVPLDWAMTQNNLGIALWRLGERESGTARLNEAVAAFREALTEQHARARPAGLGQNPEQSRQCVEECSASARAARRGSTRRSRPIAKR